MSNETTKTTAPRRPRRARALGLLAGLLAVAAVGPAGASANAVHVDSNAWMQYQPPTSGVQPFFFGGVTADKPICEKDRYTNIISSTDQQNWSLWTTLFLHDTPGGFTEYIPNQSSNFDRYYIYQVERKKIVKPNGKRIVCEPDKFPDTIYVS
jgi:hypothetical protein